MMKSSFSLFPVKNVGNVELEFSDDDDDNDWGAISLSHVCADAHSMIPVPRFLSHRIAIAEVFSRTK